MKLKKKTKKGFTLIELLIVVAIIAILAAIAIPQFAKYRIRGYNSAADSDLRNMKIALEAFATDNQVYASTTGGCVQTSPACTGGTPGDGAIIAGPASYTFTVTQGSIATTPAAMPSTDVNMVFGLSNGVLAVVSTDGTAPGADYTAVTAHTSGDAMYASDSDLTSLMRAGKDSAGQPCLLASGVAGYQLTYIPTGVAGNNVSAGVDSDLQSPWAAM